MEAGGKQCTPPVVTQLDLSSIIIISFFLLQLSLYGFSILETARFVHFQDA